MSVRRLAAVQPASFEPSAKTQELAAWWVKKYPEARKQSAVIPLLWLIQKQDGWVSEPSIRWTADTLSMPVIRVLEVATFYTMFQLEPVGSAALIQVCGTTPCRLRGADKLLSLLETEVGPKDHLSKDGLFTWQEVECLGACCNAPMAQINDLYYEDLTTESLVEILAAFRRGETPPPGSRTGRNTSEPTGGATTLLDASLYDGSRAKPITLPNKPAPPAAEGACVTPEFAAYQQNLRRMGWPLRAAGLGLILVGACLLVASKGDTDQSLRIIGFVMLGLGWGLWGYVLYVKKRWERVNPFTGPRD